MTRENEFELSTFTPYLLNQAAEAQSLAFASIYRDRYGMLRTEWRVLYHLGRYGPMTAADISAAAGLHKTKISRAVRSLEQRRYLERRPNSEDGRSEYLSLRPPGEEVFRSLSDAARKHEAELEHRLGLRDARTLRRLLLKVRAL